MLIEMSRIRIKNFGPIKEGNVENDGWIEIKKVTVFIGDQGSGKSTVAKLISTFTWLEKALVRGDYGRNYLTETNGFLQDFLKYHRMNNYFDKSLLKDTRIEYKGDAFEISWFGDLLQISPQLDSRLDNRIELPQIMYVPAERNFISYVNKPKELKLASSALKEFLTEFENAKEWISGSLQMPINNVNLDYEKSIDRLYIKGDDFRINLSEASSGFHSFVPVYLVSKFLAERVSDHKKQGDVMTSEETKRFQNQIKEIFENTSLTEPQKRAAVTALASRFNKTSFINIVEEPEQNLYPTSQKEMLNSLIGFNNSTIANKLILTTHSPYIINYLSLAVQARELKEKISDNSQLTRLDKIVPLKSTVASEHLAIYQLNDDGTLAELGKYDGIPSDNNYLNQSLAHGNELFDSLLELEQEL